MILVLAKTDIGAGTKPPAPWRSSPTPDSDKSADPTRRRSTLGGETDSEVPYEICPVLSYWTCVTPNACQYRNRGGGRGAFDAEVPYEIFFTVLCWRTAHGSPKKHDSTGIGDRQLLLRIPHFYIWPGTHLVSCFDMVGYFCRVIA